MNEKELQFYGSRDRTCDNCIRSPVCRLLKGEIDSWFAVSSKNVIEQLMRLKYELAENCCYYLE